MTAMVLTILKILPHILDAQAQQPIPLDDYQEVNC
jgi:hypothetical protein